LRPLKWPLQYLLYGILPVVQVLTTSSGGSGTCEQQALGSTGSTAECSLQCSRLQVRHASALGSATRAGVTAFRPRGSGSGAAQGPTAQRGAPGNWCYFTRAAHAPHAAVTPRPTPGSCAAARTGGSRGAPRRHLLWRVAPRRAQRPPHLTHTSRRPSGSQASAAAGARCKRHACAVAERGGLVNRSSNRAQDSSGRQARPGELRVAPRALSARTRPSARGRSCAWPAAAAGAAHLLRGQDSPRRRAHAACARQDPHLRRAARLRATVARSAERARVCPSTGGGPRLAHASCAPSALPQRSLALPSSSAHPTRQEATEVRTSAVHTRRATWSTPLECALAQRST
jgi:hypothetical protein